MSDTDSGDLNIDHDDQPIVRGPTQQMKGIGKKTAAKSEKIESNLEENSKKQLIKLMTSYGKHELRETNFKIVLINERMTHFEKAIKELEESIKIKREKAYKYKVMNNNPKKLIKSLEEKIKQDKAKIENLQKEVDTFEAKKAKKAIEQTQAKNEITKKLVKSLYKYLEKHSDPIIVKLLETFVALLRNRKEAQREDVELYLRNFNGLQTALAKVNPREIKGENASEYVKNIEGIRNNFKGENEEYLKYIPFLVYVNQTCSIVLLSVEEKQIEHRIQELEAEIKKSEKEIDEIETYMENVDDVIDYTMEADREEEQWKILSNHHELLKLRLTKLQKYSYFFEKYYFREIEKPKHLNSTVLDKIDTMDDLNKVKPVERIVGNLAKAVTRKPKEMLNGKTARDEFENSDESKGTSKIYHSK